jgi:DNA-binding NtrC family response regulator
MNSVTENKTILIVTNETVLAHQLTELFHANGYNVGISPDGVSAIDGVNERSVDLVVIDNALPDVSGAKLVKLLKNLSPKTEILYVTDRTGTIPEALSGGALTSMQKPFSLQHILLQAIKCIEVKLLREKILELEEDLGSMKDKILESPEKNVICLN